MVTKIWNEIEKGKIQSVYLLTGTEQHLIDETVKRLIRAVPGMTSSEVNRFDLEELPIQAVLEVADELPFLVEHKLIVAKNCSFLKATDNSKEKQPHQLELLEKWLENPSPTATVVFVAPYEKLDARKKITKKIKKHAVVVEAETLQGQDLTTWIMQQGTDKGIKIDKKEAAFLLEMAGTDLLTLSTEVEKLAAYLSFDGIVTIEMIEQLVARTPEMDVFRLTDSFVNGRKSESLSVYHDLLRNGEEPIMLASLIASQVRLMIHIVNLRKKGYQQQQIATTLHVHPYRVKLMMQRNLPTLQILLKALDDLATIDLQLKTTSGNRQRRLELFLLNGL
ncbi:MULTISPECIES: DNA polymerase III subunit delta [Sporosarcina]|uniref:DNA polymerase III subunit delta n=2 Tax=Sporosarcina newyorkensis TaxID=759851 RepID=A0A1T4XF69_9BACL|nr:MULTISPECIES: DNA polymerase III subunit delta [Sporosarcina]EGQ27598.1 DNA-directed DNA polymerase III delta subunit [Sporosarcina newyorkensis 2681]MBY0220979.1 DNA polymerase III subunit delta [Sporosarcina aquimarina]SKA88027.1 DNA polymerase III, delta subunit [Sporosarcina newyorkensis]